MSTPTIDQLKRAVQIAEQIQKLKAELAGLVGSSSSSSPVSEKTTRGGKRTMSPATIAKMRAAQHARWAKKNGSASTASKSPKTKKKSNLSPEGRARIVAALKARHAAAKAKK